MIIAKPEHPEDEEQHGHRVTNHAEGVPEGQRVFPTSVKPIIRKYYVRVEGKQMNITLKSLAVTAQRKKRNENNKTTRNTFNTSTWGNETQNKKGGKKWI